MPSLELSGILCACPCSSDGESLSREEILIRGILSARSTSKSEYAFASATQATESRRMDKILLAKSIFWQLG